ncbi:L-2-hydroxyglutarate oxidase [Planosporangium flavigriseum]|uniref:Hydroxyglutarate oxidase n=1 Tax=Planosporangium flavigriseum TaxID=373681 RepID=A0A8J3PKI2_9ACTN|nr:L-2-hydroxyglutarate oxidase [Planosporangium flavigriseum]NJC63978.1 L-2-hydroxyglutarate oxidase [Planosporangium flavigriseum]GIG72857.1 hydroxyglutarate oxidase [Planosporangium flavigriseum]
MRYAVIGGGIVGLATAHELRRVHPGAAVTVVEKEAGWGAHQTGHNSGVIHAGVYYAPGSLKAELCRAGRRSMLDFCAEHDIPFQVCGKLIVATDEAELPRLHALHERARANDLEVRLITPEEAREYEPEVACVAALHVAATGIVNFGTVCARLAELLEKSGADMRTGERVIGIRSATADGPVTVQTTRGELQADVLINCAGLHADRIARMAGVHPPARIVPFRGEYYELRPERRGLVRGLIYPVPDPQFPFLGVHLTKMIDGSVHAGPNAVLALAREGYGWSRIRPGDLLDAATYSGLWRLGRRHWRYGASEVGRSLSKRRFAASLARLVPAIGPDDLVKAEAGVRAQAIRPDGSLVDDFLIARQGRQVHVLNAPSPAATSSLEIAKHIVAGLPA